MTRENKIPKASLCEPDRWSRDYGPTARLFDFEGFYWPESGVDMTLRDLNPGDSISSRDFDGETRLYEVKEILAFGLVCAQIGGPPVAR